MQTAKGIVARSHVTTTAPVVRIACENFRLADKRQARSVQQVVHTRMKLEAKILTRKR